MSHPQKHRDGESPPSLPSHKSELTQIKAISEARQGSQPEDQSGTGNHGGGGRGGRRGEQELDRENFSTQTFITDDNRPAELISLSGSLAAAKADIPHPSKS